MTLVGVYERRGVEYQYETAVRVPSKGSATFAFSPPHRARLHRLMADIPHAGPVQRYRCWHGMNIPTGVTMMTLHKRRLEAWRSALVESINCRTMEALLEPVPLQCFSPVAFDVRVDLPVVETNTPVTVRIRSFFALGFTLTMRCVFREVVR